MADSKFWHVKAEEFRELEKADCLRLRWWKYADGNDPPLSLSVSDRPGCDSIEARFKLAATQCGKALAGPAVNSVYQHWINILITAKGNAYRINGESSGRKWAGGTMGTVCGECANLCLAFEAKATEEEHQASAAQLLATAAQTATPLPITAKHVKKRRKKRRKRVAPIGDQNKTPEPRPPKAAQSDDPRAQGHADAEREFWKQKKLKELQEAEQVTRRSKATPEPPAKRGYRIEVRAWMKRNGITSVKAAAKSLAVSEDVLKSIMSEITALRCSQETLDTVLKKIAPAS